MTTTRMYGRKGFTTRKAILAMLEPFERPSRRKHQTAIVDIDLESMQKVAAMLPDGQLEDRHGPNAPTMAELIAFGADLAGTTFKGYRIDADQPDERITLTGMLVPGTAIDHDAMGRIVALAAEGDMAWVPAGGAAHLAVSW